MPRPILKKSEIRNALAIYLSEQEKMTIQSKALEANMPLGAFIRRAALNQRCYTIPAINATQWAELGRMGANINQIAKHLNEGQPFSAAEAIDIDEVRLYLSEVRLALTGRANDSEDQ